MGNIKIIRNKHTFRADTGKEYIWVAYVMGSSKAYTTPDKKKEKTFGQFGSVAREFEIMIFAPDDKTLEKKNHLGMLIIRVDNKGRIIEDEVDKSNVKPEILKVHLVKKGTEEKKGVTKVSYQDTLTAIAITQGLEGHTIKFRLWEDDKQGHQKENEYDKEFLAIVDVKGVAKVENISLLSHKRELQELANKYLKKGMVGEGDEHEFRITASFGEFIKDSNQVQVIRRIEKAYFVDTNGQKIQSAKVGDIVRVCIESTGMIGASAQYFIYEKDSYTPNDTIAWSPIFTIENDKFYGREILITDDMLQWGGQKREGEDRKEQNYTIEVKTFSDSKGSKPFQITTEDLKVEYGISAVKVTIGEVNKNTKTLPANSLFLPDIQIKEVYEVKDDKNVSLEPDKEADKHIKVLDEKTSVATEYKEKDITTVKQTNSMIIRFSVTPKGGKKVGYLGLFLSTSHEAENLYEYELYYNYKNVLSPNIASITIKEGETERKFGSGYTTKINGKETEFELKITFNEDKKINSDVFIDIFSNTNAALAKPTLSGTALHRFKMKMAKIQSIITYHIYYDGRIEKHIPKEIAEEFKQKYKYVYHDEKGNEHEIGIFKILEATEMKKGNIAGTKKVELIDIREFKGYDNNGVKLKFLTINTDSKRYYINPDCYAGLFGAMAKLNIDYLGFNGFSNNKAGSYPSTSHFNGEKGDLRYLSTNRKGESTHLEYSYFDVEQQNKFNDALYLFGWGRLEKMYSEYFTYNGNSKYLLNHTRHLRIDEKRDDKGKIIQKEVRHHHHLHLTGFDHSLIKIIEK